MMILTPEEARVLGVLIEKATTTPDQYPLTLNAVVVGCNQKNNRDPITSFDDNTVFNALTNLRKNGFVVQLDTPGGRTSRYRHEAQNALKLGKADICLLAELFLRGPQTLGELRQRASRMTPFESMDGVRALLQQMMEREEPLIQQLPPVPGSRAERYAQLICPGLHPVDAAPAQPVSTPQSQSISDGYEQRLAALECEVATLRRQLSHLAASLGESLPDDKSSADEDGQPSF